MQKNLTLLKKYVQKNYLHVILLLHQKPKRKVGALNLSPPAHQAGTLRRLEMRPANFIKSLKSTNSWMDQFGSPLGRAGRSFLQRSFLFRKCPPLPQHPRNRLENGQLTRMTLFIPQKKTWEHKKGRPHQKHQHTWALHDCKPTYDIIWLP